MPRILRDELLGHARRVWPSECCGILLGRRVGAECVVEEAVGAANIAEGDRRTAYQIDWVTLFRVTRETRTALREIVGFYHSHPDGSIRPSERDREAAWIDYAYVIVSIDEASPVGLSSWRVLAEDAGFEQETLRVVDDAGAVAEEHLSLSQHQSEPPASARADCRRAVPGIGSYG